MQNDNRLTVQTKHTPFITLRQQVSLNLTGAGAASEAKNYILKKKKRKKINSIPQKTTLP